VTEFIIRQHWDVESRTKLVFDKVSALSGFQADQLLLIDDTPANVTAAQASGWNAVVWPDGGTLEATMKYFES